MQFSLLTQMTTPQGAVNSTVSATGAASVVLDAENFPIAADTLINVAFPYATLKAYYLVATQDCTVETNATDHAGGQSIALTANVPLAWITGGAGANVFTADVTKFYVTAAVAGTLSLRALYDPTP